MFRKNGWSSWSPHIKSTPSKKIIFQKLFFKSSLLLNVKCCIQVCPQRAVTTFAFLSVWFFFYAYRPPVEVSQLLECRTTGLAHRHRPNIRQKVKQMSSVLLGSFHTLCWCVKCEGQSLLMHNFAHRCHFFIQLAGFLTINLLYINNSNQSNLCIPVPTSQNRF